MFSSDKIGVLLITEDPMVEIAVRHLFGAGHHGYHLQAILTFQDLAGSLPLAETRVVLADISALENVDRLMAFRRNTPGVAILCWCGASVLSVTGVLRQKCDGVISRRASGNDLMAALSNAAGGSKAVQIQAKTREVNVHLTYRESQLVALLGRGYQNKEIAACLGITAGTVKVYLSTLFKKTGAKDRFELTLFGMKNSLYGLAEMSSAVPLAVAAKRAISRPVLTSMRLVQTLGEAR